jgi:uncharacterized protein YndB with AHSA1/START domain
MDRSVGEKAQLRLTRRYPVDPAQVWRAWTEPQALSAWFGPGEPHSVTLTELDVREGGRYRVRFQTQDGEQHEVAGVYEKVVPGRLLEFSWAWHSTPERVSRVRIELRPVPEGTELEFLQDRFFDQAARDGHERGWTATLVKLENWLTSGSDSPGSGRRG